MYGNNSKIVVAGGAYEGNTAGAEGGMAYVIQSHLNVTTGAEIFRGKAPRGGAVYARDRSIVDVRVGVTMRDNHASAHGGAVYGHTFSVIKLSENTLLLRNSASDDSGAVHLFAQSSLYASNNVTFEENTAGDDGGAITMQGAGSSGPPGVIRLERGVIFARNYAKDQGGALFVLGRSAVEVYGDVVFVENSADEGGAIAMDGSGSVCEGCGVRRHAALNPARKRSETRAHGVLARIHRRVRGGAIGVRACPSRVSAPPHQARMLREARCVCTCALGVSACCANPAGCAMCRGHMDLAPTSAR